MCQRDDRWALITRLAWCFIVSVLVVMASGGRAEAHAATTGAHGYDVPSVFAAMQNRAADPGRSRADSAGGVIANAAAKLAFVEADLRADLLADARLRRGSVAPSAASGEAGEAGALRSDLTRPTSSAMRRAICSKSRPRTAR